MNVLSRREEEQLLKSTKARAFKECDPLVKGTLFPSFPVSLPLFLGLSISNIHHNRTQLKSSLTIINTEFVDCTRGKTLSLMWSCKPELRKVEKCIYQLYAQFSFFALHFTNE